MEVEDTRIGVYKIY